MHAKFDLKFSTATRSRGSQAQRGGGGKIAVDQAGTIFMVSGYGTIYRLDSNVVLQASIATGFPHLTDIEVDETGRIVAVSDEG
jgi:hypothetical protein